MQGENEFLASIWQAYFPNDSFNQHDKRMNLFRHFKHFFQGSGRFLLESQNLDYGTIELDLAILQEMLPFHDFISTLRTQPNEVLGCLGLALSAIRAMESSDTSQLNKFYSIKPKVINLKPYTPFSSLKSNISGQLVSLCGHVIRVSAAQPYVTFGIFKCSKCQSLTKQTFVDGIFQPPTQCSTPKCKNRYLDFLRSQAITSDFQKIKIQEYIDPDSTADPSRAEDEEDPTGTTIAPNVPRTFEAELRGEELVDSCVSGDLVVMVGIVKAVQQESVRGGRGREEKRESGIHQLYLDVISVMPLKERKRVSLQNDRERKQRSTTQEPEDDLAYQEEMLFIRSLALSPHCISLLLTSFCPTIFGHELVKLGLLLGLFGGSNPSQSGDSDSYQPISSSFNIRSEIHVLVVGDPGLGKSQMLRAASRVAPRSVMVCGNTASTAGLTVALVREAGAGGEMSIEAGALVLADRGVCCIDELDKMTCDPHSLLEAMEQQSVSVAKSGVVTSLRSRATILAAANPSGGCYDRRKSVSENLKMASALLSRFDLVFIMLDKPDAGRDRLISEHIMRRTSQPAVTTGGAQNLTAATTVAVPRSENTQTSLDTLSHRIRDGMEGLRELIETTRPRDAADRPNALLGIHTLYNFLTRASSSEYLRRYIEYARRYCHPRLTPAAAKVLQKHYLTMRSSAATSSDDSIPVTTRHLESLIRLSQARARMELREEVSEADAFDVVDLLHESLLDTVTLDTGQVDFGRKGGMSLAKQVKALTQVLRKEGERKGSQIFTFLEIHEFVQLLKLKGETEGLIDVMRTESYLLLKGPKLYQLL